MYSKTTNSIGHGKVAIHLYSQKHVFHFKPNPKRLQKLQRFLAHFVNCARYQFFKKDFKKSISSLKNYFKIHINLDWLILHFYLFILFLFLFLFFILSRNGHFVNTLIYIMQYFELLGNYWTTNTYTASNYC